MDFCGLPLHARREESQVETITSSVSSPDFQAATDSSSPTSGRGLMGGNSARAAWLLLLLRCVSGVQACVDDHASPPSFWWLLTHSGSFAPMDSPKQCDHFTSMPSDCPLYKWVDGTLPTERCCACGGGMSVPPLPPSLPPPPVPPANPPPQSPPAPLPPAMPCYDDLTSAPPWWLISTEYGTYGPHSDGCAHFDSTPADCTGWRWIDGSVPSGRCCVCEGGSGVAPSPPASPPPCYDTDMTNPPIGWYLISFTG